MTGGRLVARVGRLPLRTRLVAGFAAAMLAVLTAAGAFVYWRVEYALDRGLDGELDQAAGTIAPLIGDDGQVRSPTEAAATGVSWQVLGRDGAVLDSGGSLGGTAALTADDLAATGSAGLTRDVGGLLPAADRPYRLRSTRLPGEVGYLVVGVRRDHRDEALRELLLQLALAGLGALAVTALVGDLLARAALRPVERYRRRAEEIAGGASGLRLDVPAGRHDEVTRLGDTLNEMLAALERSLAHERRFVDDASHELRTPLTLLKSRIELALRRERTPEEHERVLAELAVDVGRLIDLAEQLLRLGVPLGATGTSDVGHLVGGVVERFRLADPARAATVDLEVAPGDAPAGLVGAVDPAVLEGVVRNLIGNALLHGAAPVRVMVDRAEADGSAWVRLRVEDAGPGMPADLLAEATGRFNRSPEARSRPGAGLGLAIVEQGVRGAAGELRLCHAGRHEHRGRAVPVACDHGPGMVVTVLLPVAPESPVAPE